MSTQSMPPTKIKALGRAFVRNYYDFMSKQPTRVHAFYKGDSVFSSQVALDENSSGSPIEGRVITGIEGVTDAVLRLKFKDCVTKILSLDVVPIASTMNFHIMVVGVRVPTKGLPSRKFAQSFYLVTTGQTTYFVQTSIFRWLNSPAEVAAPAPAPAKVEESPAPAPKAPEAPVEEAKAPEPVAAEPAAPVDAPAPDAEKEKAPKKKRNKKTRSKKPKKTFEEKVKEEKKDPGPMTWARLAGESSGPKNEAVVVQTRFGTIVPRVESHPDPKTTKKPRAPKKSRNNNNNGSNTSGSTRGPRPQRERETITTPNLYVKRIPAGVDGTALLAHFAKFGEVKEIASFGDKDYAFLTYVELADAQKAHKAAITRGIIIDGKRVGVEAAKRGKDKKDRRKPEGKGPKKNGEKGKKNGEKTRRPKKDNKPKGETKKPAAPKKADGPKPAAKKATTA